MLSPNLRSRFNYVFIRENDNIAYQKKIYAMFCGMCPTFEEFKYYYTKLTEDYGSMVIQRKDCYNNEVSYFKPLSYKTLCIPFGVCPQCLRKYDGHEMMEKLDRKIFGIPDYKTEYIKKYVDLMPKLRKKGIDIDKLLEDEPKQIEPTNISDTSDEILNRLKFLKRYQTQIKSSDTSSEQNDVESEISITESENSDVESNVSSIESCKELGI